MLISKQVILTFLVTLGAYGEVLAQQPELGSERDYIGIKDYDVPDYYMNEALEKELLEDMAISDSYMNLEQNLENELVQDMGTYEAIQEGSNETVDFNGRGLRGISELNLNEESNEDLNAESNSNPIIGKSNHRHDNLLLLGCL